MEILGWIVIVVVGVIVAFFLLSLLVFLALRRRMKQIGAALEAAVGNDVPRFRVTLEPLTPFEWHDEAAAERAVTQLAAARFAESGRYTLAENRAARIVGMADETESFYAAVYELGPSGPHVDVVGRYDDGRRLTVTSVPETGLDEPDDRVTIRVPDADATTLVAAAHDRRPPGTLLPVSVDDFAAVFEAAYATEMDWRAARGGFNRSEITHAAHLQAAAMESDEIAVDNATVDLMLATFNAALFNGVDEALRASLEADTDLTVSEWEEVRDRLVFVYDNLPPKMLRARFRDCLPAIDDDEPDGAWSAAGADDGRTAGAPHEAVSDAAAADHHRAARLPGELPEVEIRDRDDFADAVAAAALPAGAARPHLLATVGEPFAADVYVKPQ